MNPSTANRADADWRDADLERRGTPAIKLACGHSSPPGSGPVAEAGYGYCIAHGVQRAELPGSCPVRDAEAGS